MVIKMPLPSYTYSNWVANLSEEERTAMTNWFDQLREEIKPDTLSKSKN